MTKEKKLEILNKIRDILLDNEHIELGICSSMVGIGLTFEEYTEMFNFLSENKPSVNEIYSHYIESEHWIDVAYWWHSIAAVPETRQIRINYLTELIENETKSNSSS